MAFVAAGIWHDGRHYYGKPTDGASFIIFEFIVLPWPINSSSLEIGAARRCFVHRRCCTEPFDAVEACMLIAAMHTDAFVATIKRPENNARGGIIARDVINPWITVEESNERLCARTHC